jgi:predicted acetyltransferase
MDWTQVLTIVGANVALMAVSIGSTISLFLWARSEARQDQAQIRDLITAIQNEMKDFHGRLERQDAEFKGKLEKQDAEFKSHLMYHHSIEERNKGK